MSLLDKFRAPLARIPRPLKIAALIYVVYVALIALVVTPLLNIYAPKIYREQTGRELHIDKIVWLNPFNLSLCARAAHSENADGSRFWAVDALRADVSLASLWRRHLVLDAVELRGLSLQIDQTSNDHYNVRYNYSDILDYRAQHFPDTAKPTDTASKDATPFAIEIDKLIFSATHIGYRAPFASAPLAATLSDFTLSLEHLSTVTKTASASGTATNTGLPALAMSNIEIAFKNIAIDSLRQQEPYALRWNDLNIAIPALSSSVDTAQNYSMKLRDSGNGTIEITGGVALAHSGASGTLTLRDIDLVPLWRVLADKLAFTAQTARLDSELHFNVDWRDKLNYSLEHSRAMLRNVQLQSRHDDSHLHFAALTVDNIAVDSTQPRARIGTVLLDKLDVRGANQDAHVSLVDMFALPSSGEEKTDSPPWQIQIDDIRVQNGAVAWQASQLPQLPLAIAPLELHANNLHWPDAAPLQIELNTTLSAANSKNSDNAKIAAKGVLTPSTLDGQLAAKIEKLPLAWGNYFVQQQMRATIANGTLTTNLDIKLDNAQPMLVQSDGTIAQFELQRLPDQQKLTTWSELRWQQAAVDFNKQSVAIKQIAIAQPWLQFRINKDGSNNFQQLLVQPSAPQSPPAANTAPAKKVDTGGKHSPPPASKPWQLAIATVHVDKAALAFRDASLSSAFRTDINALSGDITGLDNSGTPLGNSNKRGAKLNFKGTVDGYAPVALTGTMNPFAAKPTLNIALDITNLDLATLTPYSGTYAGYQIDKGTLTVQLAYKLDEGRIKGSNHIIVNQLQLGKQISGPKVVDLPLRLAIYLLTDSDGVMDLGVDVTGDVDDPDFSVGSIIWKALRNLIMKTVASPFHALGNLLGGGARDDLDRIEFTAGTDQLPPAQSDKLDSVFTALQKKPALKLGITGHVSPSQDIEALRDNTLTQQLIAQGGIKPIDFQQQSKNWQREVIKMFKQRFPNEDNSKWPVMAMNDAMRDNIDLEPTALQTLAARRALAVKQTLVSGHGLTADRAFVKPIDLGADNNPGPQATLSIE